MKCVLLLLLCALPVAAGPLEDAGLIDVQTVENLPVFVSLRYATPNNFTGKKIYSSAKCYLHKDAVEGLQKAVSLAAQEKEPFTFCLHFVCGIVTARRTSTASYGTPSRTPVT